MATQSAKAQFLEAYEREHATTAKVLRAYPKEKAEMQPHERSNSARKLAWTFVVEETMMLMALNDQQVLGGGFPPAPENWDAIPKQFDECTDR